MSDITFDTHDFDEKIKQFELNFQKGTKQGMIDVAREILRLSSFEVPHDTGLLQASGDYDPVNDGVIVGYNKVYAARLHEHPEYRFKKGRKGKYLEDPIKHNLDAFRDFMGERIKGSL